MEASTNCFFVVVAGKYLKLMENVLNIVDNVTEAVGTRPIAVIYVTKDEKITSFYDQAFHLPLVNNLTYINRSVFNIHISCYFWGTKQSFSLLPIP